MSFITYRVIEEHEIYSIAVLFSICPKSFFFDSFAALFSIEIHIQNTSPKNLIIDVLHIYFEYFRVSPSNCYKYFSRNPLSQLEEEKREHDNKMKKLEIEMEQVFEMKVREKKQKLKDLEADVILFHLVIFQKLLRLNRLNFCHHSSNVDMIKCAVPWNNRPEKSRRRDELLSPKKANGSIKPVKVSKNYDDEVSKRTRKSKCNTFRKIIYSFLFICQKTHRCTLSDWWKIYLYLIANQNVFEHFFLKLLHSKFLYLCCKFDKSVINYTMYTWLFLNKMLFEQYLYYTYKVS